LLALLRLLGIDVASLLPELLRLLPLLPLYLLGREQLLQTLLVLALVLVSLLGAGQFLDEEDVDELSELVLDKLIVEHAEYLRGQLTVRPVRVLLAPQNLVVEVFLKDLLEEHPLRLADAAVEPPQTQQLTDAQGLVATTDDSPGPVPHELLEDLGIGVTEERGEVLFGLADGGLVLAEILTAGSLGHLADRLQEGGDLADEFLNRLLRLIEIGLQVVCHPDEQVREFTEEDVLLAVVHQVVLEGSLEVHVLLLQGGLVELLPVDLLTQVAVVYVLVVDLIAAGLGDQPQQGLNVGVQVRQSSVELCKTEIAQHVQTTNHLPSALESQTKTIFRLLVVEGGRALVPGLELRVIP
jgi:hypothetical protein